MKAGGLLEAFGPLFRRWTVGCEALRTFGPLGAVRTDQLEPGPWITDQVRNGGHGVPCVRHTLLFGSECTAREANHARTVVFSWVRGRESARSLGGNPRSLGARWGQPFVPQKPRHHQLSGPQCV